MHVGIRDGRMDGRYPKASVRAVLICCGLLALASTAASQDILNRHGYPDYQNRSYQGAVPVWRDSGAPSPVVVDPPPTATYMLNGHVGAYLPGDRIIQGEATRFDADNDDTTQVDTVVIKAGDSIIWEWVAGTHTITNSYTTFSYGGTRYEFAEESLFHFTLDSGNTTQTYQFNTAGTYPYFSKDPSDDSNTMRGIIVVFPADAISMNDGTVTITRSQVGLPVYGVPPLRPDFFLGDVVYTHDGADLPPQELATSIQLQTVRPELPISTDVITGVTFWLNGDRMVEPIVMKPNTNTPPDADSVPPEDRSIKFQWMPYSNTLLAIETGYVDLVWLGVDDPEDGTKNYYRRTFLIGTKPRKEPVRMYQTNGIGLASTGAPAVGIGHLQDINSYVKVHYNTMFPEYPAEAAVGNYDNYNFWIDADNAFHSRRATGFIVLEYLRNNPETAADFVGIEIVEVVRAQPDVTDSKLVGEPLDEAHEALAAQDESYDTTPEVTSQATLVYQHAIAGEVHERIFARDNTETANISVFFKRKGILSVEWPYEFRSFETKWPTENQLYVRGRGDGNSGPPPSFCPSTSNPFWKPSKASRKTTYSLRNCPTPIN